MAVEAGRSVCIHEGAPRFYRGGNCRHTRNLRAMHDAPTSVLREAYDEEEYYQDLLRVTKGKTTARLARLALRGSQDSVAWLEARGGRLQQARHGTIDEKRIGRGRRVADRG